MAERRGIPFVVSAPSGTGKTTVCRAVVEREPDIVLRPKVGVSGSEQFPIPVQNTLTMYQSLGLVIPELLLLIGATLWLRQRTS